MAKKPKPWERRPGQATTQEMGTPAQPANDHALAQDVAKAERAIGEAKPPVPHASRESTDAPSSRGTGGSGAAPAPILSALPATSFTLLPDHVTVPREAAAPGESSDEVDEADVSEVPSLIAAIDDALKDPFLPHSAAQRLSALRQAAGELKGALAAEMAEFGVALAASIKRAIAAL